MEGELRVKVKHLAHLAVFTSWVRGSIDFYHDILDFHLVPRPDFGFPGAWLASEDGTEALIHLYGEGPVRPPLWQDPALSGKWSTGIVAHLSLVMTGKHDLINRLEYHKVPWTVHTIPDSVITQIFFYDPNGLLIECGFSEEEVFSSQETPTLWQQDFVIGGLLPFQQRAYHKWHVS